MNSSHDCTHEELFKVVACIDARIATSYLILPESSHRAAMGGIPHFLIYCLLAFREIQTMYQNFFSYLPSIPVETQFQSGRQQLGQALISRDLPSSSMVNENLSMQIASELCKLHHCEPLSSVTSHWSVVLPMTPASETLVFPCSSQLTWEGSIQ